MQELVKALGYNLHILEIIAKWLVCPLVKPVFHLLEIRIDVLVMPLFIHNKYKLGWATSMWGEDGLRLYSSKDRESSPYIFMTVNETIVKCTFWSSLWRSSSTMLPEGKVCNLLCDVQSQWVAGPIAGVKRYHMDIWSVDHCSHKQRLCEGVWTDNIYTISGSKCCPVICSEDKFRPNHKWEQQTSPIRCWVYTSWRLDQCYRCWPINTVRAELAYST